MTTPDGLREISHQSFLDGKIISVNFFNLNR